MNKVYLGGSSTTDWKEQVKNIVGVEFSQEKQDCNIHYYYIDKNSSGYEDPEIIASAENPNVHTILHINPDGLEYYQLKARKELVDYVRNLDAFAVVHNDILSSAKHINSIARIFETVNQ